jgi:hypothetical protein
MKKNDMLKEANTINKKIDDKIEEGKKIKKTRLKLDDNTLLYNENGIRKLYEIIEKTNFKESRNELGNLNKLIQIFKNWHFMLFPKYDLDYFMNRISEIGKRNSGRVILH